MTTNKEQFIKALKEGNISESALMVIEKGKELTQIDDDNLGYGYSLDHFRLHLNPNTGEVDTFFYLPCGFYGNCYQVYNAILTQSLDVSYYLEDDVCEETEETMDLKDILEYVYSVIPDTLENEAMKAQVLDWVECQVFVNEY